MPWHPGSCAALTSHTLVVRPRCLPVSRDCPLLSTAVTAGSGLFAAGEKIPLFSGKENRGLWMYFLVNMRRAYFTTFSIKRIMIVATWALVALPLGSMQVTPLILLPPMMPSATAQLTAFLA